MHSFETRPLYRTDRLADPSSGGVSPTNGALRFIMPERMRDFATWFSLWVSKEGSGQREDLPRR